LEEDPEYQTWKAGLRERLLARKRKAACESLSFHSSLIAGSPGDFSDEVVIASAKGNK
jgi:hypothetical protein